MKEEDVFRLAEELGFSHTGALNVSALRFLPEVRDMCAADRCRNYARCWTCPPYCGTLSDSAEKAAAFTRGILVQTTGNMEDDFDVECMEATGARHKALFAELASEIQQAFPACLSMGAGGCTVCKTCTCPDSPCRFPERAITSMEAYGLVVSDVCRDSGLPYYYGRSTITYTSCILY